MDATPEQTKNGNRIRVTFLGTASGLPTSRRFSQTIAIEHRPNEIIILDPADGASALMMRNNLDLSSITTIVVSHMHADHHSGLPQLLKTMTHLGKQSLVTVYMPAEGIHIMQAYLQASYLIPEWLSYPIAWAPIQIDTPMHLGEGVSLKAWENAHIAYLRNKASRLPNMPIEWQYKSYSFCISAFEKRIVYSGNVKKLDELVPYSTGCDLLISECAHIESDTLVDDLLALKSPYISLTHFHPIWDEEAHNGELERLLQPIGDKVHLMNDSDVITL